VNVIDYTFFQELEKLPFIEKIWLYGSRARGDAWDRSDIDIAIECPKASDADWHKVLDIIENADTLLKIDCVRLDELEKELSCDELKEDAPFKEALFEDRILLFQQQDNPMTDPQWRRNFLDLGEALQRLKEAMDLPISPSRIEMDGTIQRYEFCMELFWKNFKNFAEIEGREVLSPRQAISHAYQMKLFDNETLWMDMLQDRNATSHTYKQVKAEQVYAHIKTYYPAMQVAYDKLKTLYDKA